MNCNRRRALAITGAALSAAALPLRSAQAQTAAGERRYEVLDLDWNDVSRSRALPVRLYMPQAASLTRVPEAASLTPRVPDAAAVPARVPLMVFSHGIGGSRNGYSWLGKYVASHGIASLHLQHVGSDRQIWSGGNWFSVVGRLQAAAQDGEAINRALDLRHALDTLLAGDFGRRIDARRIVAAGHSYGANTTLLASGARVPRGGKLVDLHDARVAAAIAISSPPFYGDTNVRDILASVDVPSLHVTATEDIIRIPGYYSGAEDRVAVFEATGNARKWLAVYEGGSHSMFTDRGGTGGATLNPQVKAATQTLVLAFLRGVFEGDGRELAAWPQHHAALLARFVAPGAA